MTTTRTVHLLDLIDHAEIETPNPACVQVQPMEVGGDATMAVFEHPNSRIRIPLPAGLGAGRLTFGCGIKSVAWAKLHSAVVFGLGVETGSTVTWPFTCTMRPHKDPADRRWVPGAIDVPAGATAIVLTTKAKRRRPGAAWAGWADPTLVAECAAVEPDEARRSSVRTAPGPGVLVITATACRADAIGPRNRNDVTTAHLDALAADGVTLLDARANATSTPASQSAMFTGRYATDSTAASEWAPFPVDLPNLPGEFARAGFHTAGIVSMNAYRYGGYGPEGAFDEYIPAIANPYQDGPVTTRALIRHLEATTGPQLVWVDYYDMHPPFLVTADQVGVFYDGDPRDPARAHDLDHIADFHGVSPIVELEDGLQLLRRGHVGKHYFIALRDAADRLGGASRTASELADHIAADPGLRDGRSPAAMAEWLRTQIDLLARSEATPELIEWTAAALVRLETADDETLGAARGVVDHRFIEAQARAAAVLLDAQVGRIVEWLRDAGVYDDWTIVFTSPHGELLGESGKSYSHYSPAEAALRVPLIIKPSRSVGPLGPGEVRGVFDSIDLMPTLLDAYGLPVPEVHGRSLLGALREGGPLPDADSFAVDNDAAIAVVVRRPHKLIKANGWVLYDREPIGPGETRLLRIDGLEERPDPDDRDGVRDDLERALDAWLART